MTRQTHNNHAFMVEELMRFYESQKKHGKKYLQATLDVWRMNAKSGFMHKAYAEVINKLEGK